MKQTYYPPGRLAALFAVSFCISCQSPEQEKHIDYLGQKPPGMKAELFAAGLVSGNFSEHSAPSFAADGSRVLWTIMDTNYHGYIMEMVYENGKWSQPARPSFADSTADDYYPSFAVDGKKLYFCSRRKMPAGYSEGRDMSIWQVDLNKEGWGKASPFDSTVSTGKEYAHSISAGHSFYFSSPQTRGPNFNIRSAQKSGDEYSKPALLPYPINSIDYEEGPYIAPDENFLIFESQRPEGIDKSVDLYISFKNKDGRWSMPVNMGPEINSGDYERFSRLSPDGKYLFFGSGRNKAPGKIGFDIYWIDAKVIEELRNSEAAKEWIEQPLGDTIISALSRNDAEASELALKEWLNKHPQHLDARIIYDSLVRNGRK